MATQYIKKINGYVIKDEEARSAASQAAQAASTAQNTANSALNAANAANSSASGAQNTADAAVLAAEAAQGRADEAYALAEGKKSAIVYETFDEMVSGLIGMHEEADIGEIEEGKLLKFGTNIYIKEAGVSDYWVSGTLDYKETSIPSSSDDHIYQLGFYEITILEAEKPDFTNYAQKTGTYSGMTVGNATKATKATQDADGNVITVHYATKDELEAKKLSVAVANEEMTISYN